MYTIEDPIEFGKKHWPDVQFYKQQREIIYSVRDNVETDVIAGNMLGKDFVAGFIVLWFFLTRHPCRIITTSAKEDHLRVLWAEIEGFIRTSKYPLLVADGGPLILTQRVLRKNVCGEICPRSYVVGRVASQDSMAAMQGHHVADLGDGVPRTMFLPDECSSVPHAYYLMARTWFQRMLAIGNPWPCDNWFKWAVHGEPGTNDKGGDIKALDNGHYYRKVIEIKAENSPNVRLALAQVRNGKKPTGEMLIPGVKSYAVYMRNRTLWNKIEQCVGLDAKWYEGPELKMFPPEWLNLSETEAEKLGGNRRAVAMGVDSAMGGDNTSWAVVDGQGLIYLESMQTPDTTVITSHTLYLMRKYGLRPENVLFDTGGCGKAHGDRLRQQGYTGIRIINFGESATPEKKRGMTVLEKRKLEDETRSAYKNRRVEMYYCLRNLMDPANGKVFALPKEYTELRRQLMPIPVQQDGEGTLVMPPKNKRDREDTRVTMTDLIGCSPDEADAVVLAVFGMSHKPYRSVAGAA